MSRTWYLVCSNVSHLKSVLAVLLTVSALFCLRQTTDEEERLEVTRALGKMFGAKESQLSIENKPLWQSFLGRYVV